MKPRFTLITHDYLPATGGISRYLSSLVRAAKGNISVWVPNDHPVEEIESSAKITKVHFWWGLWPRWIPLIKRCLEVPKDNKILISHVFPIGTAAWIAKKLGATDYVIIFHGTDIKRAQTKWKRWLLRQICKNASLLIVNSEATQKILKRLVPTSQSIILTPGFEPFDVPDKLKAREIVKASTEKTIILAVCRLVERKGVDTLIQAVANLNNHNIELVVIGDGPYKEQLQNLAELSGINVRWITDATDQIVHYWYGAADIFCLPGREIANDIEGFGIVYLEAAYAGLPVIAGDNGGTSEAIINNKTGLLIEPNVEACTSALNQLLNNTDVATKMGIKGQERVINFFNWQDRWEKLSDKFSDKNTAPPIMQTSPNEQIQMDISVVIPCFNHAEELKQTLRSLWRQTIKVKEIIIVDDASTDDIGKAIYNYKERLPIKLIRHNENKGAQFARNTGLKEATGEFIIFLDADIILDQNALKKLHKAMVQNPQASFAYCDFYWGKVHFKGQPFTVESLQKLNYIHTSSLIRTRDVVEFDESLKKFQDWDIWLTMASMGKTGIWVPETLFQVTERKSGTSHWLPSFVHKIPWPIFGFTPNEIKRYRTAEAIIRKKHNI